MVICCHVPRKDPGFMMYIAIWLLIYLYDVFRLNCCPLSSVRWDFNRSVSPSWDDQRRPEETRSFGGRINEPLYSTRSQDHLTARRPLNNGRGNSPTWVPLIRMIPESKISSAATLWSITDKNTDWSTGPLARPFARSLAPLTRTLAPDGSLRSRPPLRSLVRSLAHFAHSLARGKVNF